MTRLHDSSRTRGSASPSWDGTRWVRQAAREGVEAAGDRWVLELKRAERLGELAVVGNLLAERRTPITNLQKGQLALRKEELALVGSYRQRLVNTELLRVE